MQLRASRRSGFTLLELLVVVFIVGLATALAAVTAAPGDAAIAEREARRLAALLELAIGEARASGESLAWTHEPDGYAFWRRADDGGWAPFPDWSAFRRRSLSGATVLREVRVEERPVRPGERMVLPPTGFVAQFAVTLAGGEAQIVLRGSALGRVSFLRLHAG
jgi:general secretion pathway protein H